MTKCGVLVLLVGTAVFGVEGMRLKTAKEDIKSVAGDEELLDFDQMPDQADMDFYAETAGETACTKASLPTDAAWKALGTKTMKTPSNYCHQQKSASWFCFSGVCKDMSTAGAGGCLLNETVSGDRATHCPDEHFGNQALIDDCLTGGKRTEEGWWYNMLPYDSGFGCWANGTYAADSCLGPYPSLSCNSRNSAARVAAGKLPREASTSYCYLSPGAAAGLCLDVMVDKDICAFAPGSGGPFSKGKKTTDGWTLADQGYNLGVGCGITVLNPLVKAAINMFNGEAMDDGSLAGYVDDLFEPAREVFMEIYPMRHQLNGWLNLKQKTGFMIDTSKLGNLAHTGSR